MSGFNFDTFEESKKGGVPVPIGESKVPCPPSTQNPVSANSSAGNLVRQTGNAAANVASTMIAAQNPTLLILKLVDDALQIIPNLAACYSTVTLAKEETQRIMAEIDGEVQIAKLETQQAIAEQRENTERFRIQCESDLERQKNDLLQLKLRLEAEGNKSKNHKESLMGMLEKLDKEIDYLIEKGNKFSDHLFNNYMNMSTEERMHFIDKINEIGDQLVTISQNIVSLRSQLEAFNGD